MRRSDFSPGMGRSSLPPCDLPSSGPEEISWGKVEQCPAASAPNTRRPRSDTGCRVAGHTHPVRRACAGVHLRSVLRFASSFHPTRPRGKDFACPLGPISVSCSCLRLAVASDRPRKGLPPPIAQPCPAHPLRPTASASSPPQPASG